MVKPETPDILRRIVEAKRAEVERLKIELPVARLEERIEAQPPPLNLAGVLWGASARFIAEIVQNRACPLASGTPPRSLSTKNAV